jgi:acylphosphatase
MVCKRLIFFGRVQGVGFRYTAHALAGDFAVAGYVRNLHDGSVELVAEGAQDQVDAFLNAVTDRMGDTIRRVTVQDQQTFGFQGFEIRR